MEREELVHHLQEKEEVQVQHAFGLLRFHGTYQRIATSRRATHGSGVAAERVHAW